MEPAAAQPNNLVLYGRSSSSFVFQDTLQNFLNSYHLTADQLDFNHHLNIHAKNTIYQNPPQKSSSKKKY